MIDNPDYKVIMDIKDKIESYKELAGASLRVAPDQAQATGMPNAMF